MLKRCQPPEKDFLLKSVYMGTVAGVSRVVVFLVKDTIPDEETPQLDPAPGTKVLPYERRRLKLPRWILFEH